MRINLASTTLASLLLLSTFSGGTLVLTASETQEPTLHRADYAALYADVQEDEPLWFCPVDGNRRCGPDVKAFRYKSPRPGRIYQARCVTYPGDGHTVCRRNRDGLRWVQRWGTESR